MTAKRSIALLAVGLTLMWRCAAATAEDWPQWGGRGDRNMVSPEKHLPDTFDPKTKQNVLWTVKLGKRTYGTPVVAGGRVFIGSENGGRGWLLCLDERTGKLLWELIIPRLSAKVAPHADGGFGVCSTVTVQGDRAYVVTNRNEVLCLDVRGMANGNAGPFKKEARYLAGPGKGGRKRPRVKPKRTDGDIVWGYDMVAKLEVRPHDASSSSVLIHGGLLYVGTGNGVAAGDKTVPFPQATSLIALDKATGRLVARDNEKIGTRLYKGQWSSPALAKVGGKTIGIFTIGAKTLIIYGAGDGVCYAFEPARRARGGRVAILKKVWSVDCIPPELKVRDGKPIRYKHRDGPSEIIATPVFHEDRVYVMIGQDTSHGNGKGSLTCIDAVSGRKLWSYDKIGRSISTVSVADGLVYAAEVAGKLNCLDAETGEHYWTAKAGGRITSSTLLADGKIYLGTSRGLSVFAAGKTAKLLSSVRLASAVNSTPTAANGVLYVATQRNLYAVRETKETKDK